MTGAAKPVLWRWQCAKVAEKLAPVGYADKETYMNAYRACVGRLIPTDAAPP